MSNALQQNADQQLIKIKEGAALEVNQPAAAAAFGSTNPDFLKGIVGQIVNVSSKGSGIDEKASAFTAAMIAGAKPQDEIEAMLAAQMAAVHNAAMTFARRLATVENIPQQDSASRAFNQLARTFVAQVEALKRYRNGGQQKVTVEHVHVHGGQAIVGNIERGGRRDGG